MAALKFAQIVVQRPLPGALTYEIPDSLLPRVRVGSLVRIPFRSQVTEGFVVGLSSALKEGERFEPKQIIDVPIEEAFFTAADLKFFQWIADYYQLPIGEVFRSAFPRSVFQKASKVNDLLRDSIDVHDEAFFSKEAPFDPTEDQSKAIEALASAVRSAEFRSFLLFGVTGSGKTEVYLRVASEALRCGRAALILVPEIALTPQLTRRFEERFGSQVAVLHSGLTEKERREHWWAIRCGRKSVVVGARSALFAPLDSIGLVVVDEEHEPSYKQEDRLRYNARDLAIVRAKLHQAVVVLGSATPSLETFFAAKNGRHALLELRNRPNERPLPEIQVVDMKGVKGHFSPAMKDGMGEALRDGNQCMVFVNRKGFANFLLCSECGEVPKCVNCSVALTYYRGAAALRCHYCGHQAPAPTVCPACKSIEIKKMGFGTEAIEDELRAAFPAARVRRLDAETVDTKKKLDGVLKDFREGAIDILVGTQMLAKGHDFPNVTFIGIVLADTSLHLPDFRAAERAFQLMTQVAGRAGRADKIGKVVLQTFVPTHYAVTSAAKQDYRGFYETETGFREEFGYPPFSKMAQVEFRHLNESKARDQAFDAEKLLHSAGIEKLGVEYLGPAAAAIARIANQHRWQLLLKAAKSSSLNAVVKTLRKSGVRFIDVDPVTTL